MNQLADYLRKSGLSAESFAAKIGVSKFAVRKWLNGERVPRDKSKAVIAKATKGAVKVQDWIEN